MHVVIAAAHAQCTSQVKWKVEDDHSIQIMWIVMTLPGTKVPMDPPSRMVATPMPKDPSSLVMTFLRMKVPTDHHLWMALPGMKVPPLWLTTLSVTKVPKDPPSLVTIVQGTKVIMDPPLWVMTHPGTKVPMDSPSWMALPGMKVPWIHPHG